MTQSFPKFLPFKLIVCPTPMAKLSIMETTSHNKDCSSSSRSYSLSRNSSSCWRRMLMSRRIIFSPRLWRTGKILMYIKSIMLESIKTGMKLNWINYKAISTRSSLRCVSSWFFKMTHWLFYANLHMDQINGSSTIAPKTMTKTSSIKRNQL